MEVSRRSQDVVGRGGKARAASSCPLDKHGRRFMSGPGNTDERYQPSWQMQRMTQSKKATNTFISTVSHTNVSLPSHTRGEIFIWHERERKEANICRLEMMNKVVIISFYFGAPHPPAPASFWLLAFYSPISGWEYMTGWIVWFPAKPQHRKRDLSCLG